MWRPGRLRRLREYLSNGLFSFSLCAVRDRRRYWAGTEGRYVDQASQVRNRLFAGGRWIRTLRWREMDSNFRFLVTRPSNRHGRRHCFLENGSGSVREPKFRIHLPPAESPSLSRIRFRKSRTRLSARVCAAGLATGSAETRRVFRYHANRRRYLCRAIFQYRSAADGVGGNVPMVPTKSEPSPELDVR